MHGKRHQTPRHEIKTVEVPNEVHKDQPHVSALDWSSEGFGIPNDDGVPAEYLFDGGATDAVSNDCSQLINYLPLPSSIPIKTATNDSNAVILGKGQLKIEAENGGFTTIDNVYYCPKANSTIISPGALIAKGARMSMNDNYNFKIRLNDGKTIHAIHKNRRWFIKSRTNLRDTRTPISKYLCEVTSSVCSSQVWYNRMGHVSMKRIKRLFKNHEEYGLPPLREIRERPCEDCMKCKSTRNRTLGRTNCEVGLLDIVVTDVAGPFSTCFTGEKLFVTFRDIATSYSEICIIKHKSEVAQRLMNVVKRWERATGRKVETIRSDRGGKYMGGNLEKWLKEEGISHEFSNPYEPEQNGNAERLNRTLGEMARTLLSHKKLPQNFWNFAYLTAAYLHNRIPN